MQWFQFSEFLFMLRSYRSCYITGHYGSGKTVLAVALAYELWRQGYVDNIVTVMPCAGARLLRDVADLSDSAVVVDEAHNIADNRNLSGSKASDLLQNLRKRNTYILAASYQSVDKRLRTLTVQRSLMIGNLLWAYSWVIEDRLKPIKGWFALTKPAILFGSFDTKFEPDLSDYGVFSNVQNNAYAQAISVEIDSSVPAYDAQGSGKKFHFG